MKYSVIQKSEMRQYDFGHDVLSPDFFLPDKVEIWNALKRTSIGTLSYYFDWINDAQNSCDGEVICYDLTDGLPKFFDGGRTTSYIASTKKIALPGDFAISRLRSYLGEMGMVEERNVPQLFSSEFIIFRSKGEKLSAHALFALCMTDMVQTILDRSQYGTEHPRFYEFILQELPIPSVLLSLNPIIVQIIQNALQARHRARDMHIDVVELVGHEFGLNSIPTNHRLIYQKNYAQTFTSGRIDAEYFTPNYEELIKIVQSYHRGWSFVGDICCVNEENFQPQEDRVYSYIQISNIFSGGEIAGCMTEFGQNLPSRARRRVGVGDVIVSTVEGSLSRIALIREDHDQYLCSTGFQVIRSNEINPETLYALMSTPLGQLQLKRGCSGTNLTAINSDEFSKIVLPHITEDKQREIQCKVSKCLELRKTSRYLLQCAKEMVERAITDGEASAMGWLNRQAL